MALDPERLIDAAGRHVLTQAAGPMPGPLARALTARRRQVIFTRVVGTATLIAASLALVVVSWRVWSPPSRSLSTSPQAPLHAYTSSGGTSVDEPRQVPATLGSFRAAARQGVDEAARAAERAVIASPPWEVERALGPMQVPDLRR